VNLSWPVKRAIFGIDVSVTNYAELTEAIVRAARERRAACIESLSVHGLMTATNDPQFRQTLEQFDAVAPDGQPVRFALNVLHRANLTDRVRATDLTLRVCERAAAECIKIYLFGGNPDVVEALRQELERRFDRLQIVGSEPGIYRPLSPLEEQALVDRINRSGAAIVLLGLGCPRQELFAARHRTQIRAVQLCVGASFDFISGKQSMAPLWMQRIGLEWLFRLMQEPRRLWKRYLDTNSRFIVRFIAAVIDQRRRRGPTRIVAGTAECQAGDDPPTRGDRRA
jgi:N-acetylglucosaminyldiphosphoundecaprenol N-acetyl-beta-D-mannosaminyltransferase